MRHIEMEKTAELLVKTAMKELYYHNRAKQKGQDKVQDHNVPLPNPHLICNARVPSTLARSYFVR